MAIPLVSSNIDAWTVEYLHADCAGCEHAAEMATERARSNKSMGETWKHTTNSYGSGETHEATVVRV